MCIERISRIVAQATVDFVSVLAGQKLRGDETLPAQLGSRSGHLVHHRICRSSSEQLLSQISKFCSPLALIS